MKPNHHRRSIRIQGYDYGQAGLYFITLCCHDRVCRFGHVENGIMVLNERGRIAHAEWLKTSELRPNVELGAYVVMPNHFHAIIQIIRRGEIHSPMESRTGELHSHIRIRVPVRGPSQTIGAIIRGYKSAVTRQLGLNGGLWQRNYYESIIRDEISCIFL